MRKCKSVIATYQDMLRDNRSPAIFKEWAAVSLLGGAIRRRRELISNADGVFANQFVVLTGPAGSGKSMALKPAINIAATCGLHVSPNSMTKEKLFDDLSWKEGDNGPFILPHYRDRVDGETGEDLDTACMNIFVSEIINFIKPNDTEFLTSLCDLWDCPDSWEHAIKTGRPSKMPYPYINMIGGATPQNLADILPERAFKNGFAARLVMVWADAIEGAKRPIIPIAGTSAVMDHYIHSQSLLGDLTTTIDHIANGKGYYSFHAEVAQKFLSWVEEGMPPIPKADQLSGYNERRILHFYKLLMIMSADHRDDLIIDQDAFDKAKDLMLRTEADMPKALELVTGNFQLSLTRTIWKEIYSLFGGGQTSVPEMHIQQVLGRHVVNFQSQKFIDQFIAEGRLLAIGNKPMRKFRKGPDFEIGTPHQAPKD